MCEANVDELMINARASNNLFIKQLIIFIETRREKVREDMHTE